MRAAEGKSIQRQIAYGRLRFYKRTFPEFAQFSRLEPEEEEDRFLRAKARTRTQLAGFYNRALQEVGEEIANIFTVHSMLLDDEDFNQTILRQIRDRRTTAEYAVRMTGKSFVTAFREMKTPYMQARAADIRDVSRRLTRTLLDEPPLDPLREGPAILVAREFLPSEVMYLDRRRLLGLISQMGSVDSHTAMLLEAYHIPAMAEVDLDPSWDGHTALLDGFSGRLYLDPDQELQETLRVRYEDGGLPEGEVRTAEG